MAVLEPMESRLLLTTVGYSGTVQIYTAAQTGVYALNVAGAQGGSSGASGAGGLGAVLSGDVSLTTGEQLVIVVGGTGSAGGGLGGLGGGGGSFVFVNGATSPLVVAGGGGGGGVAGVGGGNGQPGLNGENGSYTVAGPGGLNGLGGGQGIAGTGDGGGGNGWFGTGGGTLEPGIFGISSGGLGGHGPSTFTGGAGNNGWGLFPPNGGFGGGGGGGYAGGGGGGGYAGGGGGGGGGNGGGPGGGGGSYFDSLVTSTTTAVTEAGNGSVSIVGLLTATAQTVAVTYETAQPITLSGTDPGAPGLPLAYAITSNPANGTLSGFNAATGNVSYKPGTGFTGTDSFIFTASDGTNTSTATVNINVAASNTAPWMSTQPDSIPLTDLSLPGTYKTASGPGLTDALFGTGSSNVVSTGLETNLVLAAHLAASFATEATNLTGGESQIANGAAIAADAAALAADVVAGITSSSAGAGFALGLTSDITSVASAIAGAAQTAVTATDNTTDAAAAVADSAGTTQSTAAATADGAAAAANTSAGTADGTAGTADAASGTADATAGTTDGTAGTADAAAGVSDGVAATADGVAAVQGSINPITDGLAAVADGVAAGLDTTATLGDTAADVANTASGVANGASATANSAATTANGAADSADAAAGSSYSASAIITAALISTATAAATAHTATAVSDGVSASAYGVGAASDALTAQQYAAFTSGMSTPDTTGGNPTNTAVQAEVYTRASDEATTHSASAAAEIVATAADGVAAGLDTIAATANTAVVAAVEAEGLAHTGAATANAAAVTANAAAIAADAAATAADAAATAANAAATIANTAAGTADGIAGTADGITAAADTAAATADTTAIALDITALATIEIPLVDIATAAAAGIADGVALGLDATATAADVATAILDGAGTVAGVAATTADTAAVTADAAAVAADAAATTADTAAVAADALAAEGNATAAAADTAALTACETAVTANSSADTADKVASLANHVATLASGAASGADVAFTMEATNVQNVETSLQTQTLSTADQLNAGVRSLDLRGSLVNDTINLNDGQYFTGTTLQNTLNDMTSFLQANPSETIVVSLSANENPTGPINSPNGFNADLNTLLNSSDGAVPGTSYKDYVYYSANSSTTPDLGQVRGKIVFVPSADHSWTPAADTTTGLQIGWQPTEVDQDAHTVTDPNVRWNYAENDNGANDTGLIPTDLGNPSTLYRNNLSQDNTPAASPVALGDQVDAIAEQYFGGVKVTRTTGIVGIDDPSQNLINEIINENTLPIIVTSDSDAQGAAGTLRTAIIQANSRPGLNTIEFADSLTGPTRQTIVLQSDLPLITNDLDIAGSVTINTNNHIGLQNASNHNVIEIDSVASDSGPVTQAASTDSTPVYVNTSGLTVASQAPVTVSPVDIIYGTRLGHNQLNGIATYTSNGTTVTIPGDFDYTTDDGSILHAGNGQIEAVIFTPFDRVNYTSVSGTVIVNVAKATPTLSSMSPVNITYGTALANGQIHGGVQVKFGGGTITPPGTFIYTTAAGTVLHAAVNGQSESVTFIPTDTADYTSASSTVNVHVATAVLTVTSVNPVNITYGTLLNNAQLSGTAAFTVGGNTVTVPGTFTYTTAAGALLTGGNGHIEAVTFTPADTTDYKTVFSNVIVNVTAQGTPTVVGVNPVNISYGTALANAQLGGSATFVLAGNTISVPGTFTYTTAAGSVLNPGNGQSETVTFTPTDVADYTTASSNVIVNVAQAAPTLAGVNPVNITYGTVLANAQVSGTATFTSGGNTLTVPGTFTYTSAAGSILSAGNGQSEAVTFTPTGSTNYTSVFSNVIVNVARATPILASVGAVNIAYGTALANGQLNDTATFNVGGNSVPVAGTFSYTTAAGSVLNPGNGQSEAVTFTPNDATDYTTAFSNVTVTVATAVPMVTVTDAGGVYTGSPYPATGTVTGVAGANLGTPTIKYYLASDTTFANPLTGAPGNVGSYVAVGTYAGTTDYAITGIKTNFAITAATPTVKVTDAGGTYSGLAFAATATVTGLSGTPATTLEGVAPSLTYYVGTTASGTGSTTAPVNAGTYTVVAHFPGSADYAPASANATFTVNRVTLSVTAANATKVYGAPLPTLTAKIIGFVNGETSAVVTGTLAFTTLATATSNVGTYAITPALGTLTAGNYSFTFNPGPLTLTITAAATTVTLGSSAPAGVTPGQIITFTANVTPLAPGAGSPTGKVQFYVDGVAYGSPVTTSNGVATTTDAALSIGSHAITASYTSDTTNFTAGTAATPLTQPILKYTLAFSNLSAPTMVLNTPFVTLGGTLTGSGPVKPTGTITITAYYNGAVEASHTANVASTGSFSSQFLSVFARVGQHTLVYSYSGDANYAASSSTTTGVVTYGTNSSAPATKAGNTVNVKTQLTDVIGLNFSKASVAVTATGLALAGNPNTIIPLPAGNVPTFSYANGAYTLSLKTAGLVKGTYILYFTAAGDPVTHSVQFVLN